MSNLGLLLLYHGDFQLNTHFHGDFPWKKYLIVIPWQKHRFHNKKHDFTVIFQENTRIFMVTSPPKRGDFLGNSQDAQRDVFVERITTAVNEAVEEARRRCANGWFKTIGSTILMVKTRWIMVSG